MSAQMRKKADNTIEKKELAEVTIDDISTPCPQQIWRLIPDHHKINVLTSNKTLLFNMCVNNGYYEYAQAIFDTRFRPDKKGMNVNLVDYLGYSPCKAVILRITKEYDVAKIPQAYVLLEDLTNAEINLASDANTDTDKDAAGIKNQTPLDFALQCAPPNLKLNLNCTWKGFPEHPPEVFPPVRMLLKAIHAKHEKEMSAYKNRIDAIVAVPLASFSSALRNIVLDYSAEPLFEFTTQNCRYQSNLLRLGRLFYKYDHSIPEPAHEKTVEVVEFSIPTNTAPKTSGNTAKPSSGKVVNIEAGESFSSRLANLEREQILLRQEFAAQGDMIRVALGEQTAQLQKLTSLFEAFTQSVQKASTTQSQNTGTKGLISSLFSR